jgi:hypothetical protein
MDHFQESIPMHGKFADNLADGWMLNGCPSISRQDSGTRSPLSMSGFVTPTITPVSLDHNILCRCLLSALLDDVGKPMDLSMDSGMDGSSSNNSIVDDGSTCAHQVNEAMHGIDLPDEGTSAAPDSSSDTKMEVTIVPADLSHISGSHGILPEITTPPHTPGTGVPATTVSKTKKKPCVNQKSAIVPSPRKSQRLQDRANRGLAPGVLKRS